MKHPSLIIDLDRCVGCLSCTVACQVLHETPAEYRRLTVHQIGPLGSFPDLTMYFLPVVCQHCENPPCLDACPTGATRIDENGLVVVAREECDACGDCVPACPYGARYVNESAGIAESCNYCVDKALTNGQPFCAVSCSTNAIRLIQPDQVDPTVEKWLAEGEDVRFNLATDQQPVGPRGAYILRRQHWSAWQPAKPDGQGDT